MPNKLNLTIADELSQRYPRGTDYIVVGYNKLTSPETTELRKTLRDSKVQMTVVKNSIASRALEQNGIGAGAKYLQGPSAIIAGKPELPLIAKLVCELTKKYEEKLFLRGACLDGTAYDVAMVRQLATIPPLPVLHARFAGSVQAPISRLAGTFQSIARSLACALEEIRKQKEGSAPQPIP